MLKEIPNFLTSKEVDKVVRMFDQLDSRDGKETAGSFIKNLKKSTIYNVPSELTSVIFPKNMFNILEPLLGPYFKVNTCRLSIYNNKDKYDWHVDSNTPKNNLPGNISYTLFLNNPSSYNGGNLEIETESGIKSFKCKKGTLLVYPANYLHRVTEITRGSRKVALGWMHSTISTNENRFLYHKLSTALSNCTDLYESLEDCKQKTQLRKDIDNLLFLKVRLLQLFR